MKYVQQTVVLKEASWSPCVIKEVAARLPKPANVIHVVRSLH